jgi:hypothetical protein
MAVAALISAIVGLPLLCCWIGVAGSILGIVLGLVSRRNIRESGGALTGDGLALAAIIVGAAGCALFAAGFLLNAMSFTFTQF